MNELARAVLDGNRRALARLLTQVENEVEDVEQNLNDLFPNTGNAWVIGITGAPGTGKSTLVSALAKAYREDESTVGILAVDPTSPFSGGAILGDRIRMQAHSGDPGVFIRSMATRGSLGGLARATRDAIRVLDAAGFDFILVETVGAGQSEVDIVRTAHTTLVVDAPGLGDDVQAIKAGILEIADVLVVNKADRPGAELTVRALKTMLELGHPVARRGAVHNNSIHSEISFWIPPVVQTVATKNKGITELTDAISAHQQFLQSEDVIEEIEQGQIEMELVERLRAALLNRLMMDLDPGELQTIIERIQAKTLSPQQAVLLLLDTQNVIK